MTRTKVFGPVVLIGLLWMGSLHPAHAQEAVDRYRLPEFYRTARLQVQIERLLQEAGPRARPHPPAAMPARPDSIRSRIRAAYGGAALAGGLPFEIETWHLASKFEQNWFEKKFQETRWAFLGSNTFATLDTTYTRELRARMQAQFGPPTKTLAEADRSADLRQDQNIQFEYWFILNDSIPLVVMDVNGPFERGVVVASESRYRAALPEVRQALLGRLLQSPARAPYVDYYFEPQSHTWYRTGFDGERFFLDPIRRPNLALGRPHLETRDS